MEENKHTDESMIHLLNELEAGIRSAEKEGWISEEEFLAHIRDRKDSVR